MAVYNSGITVELDGGDPIVALLAFDGIVALFRHAGEAPTYVRDVGNSVEQFLRDRFAAGRGQADVQAHR